MLFQSFKDKEEQKTGKAKSGNQSVIPAMKRRSLIKKEPCASDSDAIEEYCDSDFDRHLRLIAHAPS
jgi:hypothetical protein